MPGVTDIIREPGGELALAIAQEAHDKTRSRIKKLSLQALRVMPPELRKHISQREYEEFIVEAYYRESGA